MLFMRTELDRRDDGLFERDLDAVRGNGVVSKEESDKIEDITRRNLLVGVGLAIGLSSLAMIPSMDEAEIASSRAKSASIANKSFYDLVLNLWYARDTLQLLLISISKHDIAFRDISSQCKTVAQNYRMTEIMYSLAQKKGDLLHLAKDVDDLLSDIQGYFDDASIPADEAFESSRALSEKERIMSKAIGKIIENIDQFLGALPDKQTVERARVFIDANTE